MNIQESNGVEEEIAIKQVGSSSGIHKENNTNLNNQLEDASLKEQKIRSERLKSSIHLSTPFEVERFRFEFMVKGVRVVCVFKKNKRKR